MNPTDQDSSGQGLPQSPEELQDAEKAQREADEKILKVARQRFDLCAKAEEEFRDLALEDIKFSLGDQWPANIQQDRNSDKRPCLTINKIPQYIQQITNDQRQNRPAIKVHPVGNGAEKETAKILQGLIRHIEYNSDADVAYDTAFDFAARGGIGYWRVTTGYVSPDSFDQELYIERIKNNFSVYLDPGCKKPDGSDSGYGFICDWMPKAQYQDEFPDSEMATAEWSQVGNRAPAWFKDGAIQISEYFYKEYRDEKIHLLNTGKTVKDKDLEEYLNANAEAQIAANKQALMDNQPPPVQEEVKVVKTRIAKVPRIVHLKINGVEILERTTFPGKFIPIVPVLGTEVYVDGKRTIEGLVRHAKDPQRMYNYWKSAQTEAIALAPRAPFIGAEGQFQGHEKQWKEANIKNHPYLQYKPKALGGVPLPPPQRQTFEPAIQAITEAAAGTADDLKATTGMWDPTLGRNQSDQSGIAIQRLTNQSQTGNYHFTDNLNRGLKHTGRILIWAIPEIYDAERTQRIIKEDDSQTIVELNKEHLDENGKKVLYAMDVGTYDVTVDVGPSFATKRQEAAASMLDFTKHLPPNLAAAIADLVAKNMDWNGSQDIADRLRKMLPPNLQADMAAAGGQVKNLPPQVKQQLEQMDALVQKLQQEVHEQAHIIETKQVESQSRERIAMIQAQTELIKTEATLGSQGDLEVLRQEVGLINRKLDFVQSPQIPGEGPGAQGAGEPEPQPPTGGAAPGQPMETSP